MLRQALLHGLGRSILCITLACVLIKGEVARAESTQPDYQLAAAGNDEILWLVVGQWSPQEKSYLHWLFYLDKTANKISALPIRPQVGWIENSALLGENLHVFFDNGVHYRYRKSGAVRQIRLPGSAVPEAIAGDSAGSRLRLWAVVDAKTADAVEIQWTEILRDQATQPAGDNSPSSQINLTSPADHQPTIRKDVTYHLVQYVGTDWQSGFAAPESCRFGKHFWLCVSGDRHYLFWQAQHSDSEINFAFRQKNVWSTDPSIPLEDQLYCGFVNMINRQLIFTALVKDGENPQQLRCQHWVWLAGSGEENTGRWQRLPPLKDENEKELHLPVGSLVSAFVDKLVLFKMGEKEAQVGFWATSGGPPAEPFREVPVSQADQEPNSLRAFKEYAPIWILAAVLLLVYWRRQESIVYPIALPAGMLVVSPGKRSLAALIDLAPAAAVILWIYYDPINTFVKDFNACNTREDYAALSWPRELVWAWIWFRLAYMVYCITFEFILTRTPGKLLMDCEILSESLNRPNPVQVAIRNVSRLVELEPLLQIWPFVLVIFFTRNRQRIGDLLARTIVVERQTISLDTSEDSDTTESDQ